MQQVGHLQELHEKYYDKGFRIVAISAEPAGTIEKAVKENRGAAYWMGSDPSRETMSKYLEGRGAGIPHAYLVDAYGFVVSEGFPSDQKIEELLADALDTSLERELHRSLGSAVRAFEKGDWGKAWSAAERYLEDEDAQLAADAKYLRERCEAIAAWYRKAAEKCIEARDFTLALDDLAGIQKNFGGLEAATWAQEKEKELSSDAKVKEEVAAWKAWEKASRSRADAGDNDRKLATVKVLLERLIKKYPGTRAAELAQDALGSIGG